MDMPHFNFTENSYEQALIGLFKGLGYQYECGYDVEHDTLLPCLMSCELKVNDIKNKRYEILDSAK